MVHFLTFSATVSVKCYILILLKIHWKKSLPIMETWNTWKYVCCICRRLILIKPMKSYGRNTAVMLQANSRQASPTYCVGLQWPAWPLKIQNKTLQTRSLNTHAPAHGLCIYRTLVSQSGVKPLSCVWHIAPGEDSVLPSTPNKDIGRRIAVISSPPGVRAGKMKRFSAAGV